MNVTAPIACELQQKLPLMTAMSDVPDVTREKMTVCARHRFSLEVAFRLQKVAAKLLNDAFYAILCCQIKKLPWSDPAPGN